MFFAINYPAFAILPHLWSKMTFVVGQVDDTTSMPSCSSIHGSAQIAHLQLHVKYMWEWHTNFALRFPSVILVESHLPRVTYFLS